MTEFDVFKPHVNDRLKRSNHITVVLKHQGRFADGEVQHVGYVHRDHAGRGGRAALNHHFQNFRAIPFAVAVLAAQVNVAQELHLDVFEAGAAAQGTTAIAVVETEFCCGVAALAGQVCIGEYFADRVPRAHITGGVGTRRFADG